MNSTPSLKHDGLILEYFLATCPNWTPDDIEGHFRAEASMTGDTNQYLKQTLPDTTPDTCSACDTELNQEYSVVTWSEDQRVKAKYALSAVSKTNGQYQLKFKRKQQPPSGITKQYFSDKPDTALYLTLHAGNLYATTDSFKTDTIELPAPALKMLCTHYPVEAVEVDDTPLERFPEETDSE